ncbi:MAG: hypothetical protein ACREFI_19640 [Stellaceae bacterium]
MIGYPHVHTAPGLREEAERCFRLASSASDKRLHDELLAYGKELVERAEKIEAAEKSGTRRGRERRG